MNLSKFRETVEERSLACCTPWGCKKSDTTQSLLKWQLFQKDFSGHLSKIGPSHPLILSLPYFITF